MSKAALANSSVPKGFNELLEKLSDIPTLPIVATKVNELINDPHSSSVDIANVLKKDQVLTAKILKLINSPYYGIPSEVTDVQRALAFLGFNTIAQLVLGLSVFSLFPNHSSEEFSLVDFWRHALATAFCSEIIAKKIKYPKPEECFTCGLLHDIGKIVMHEIAKPMFFEVVSLAKNKKLSFIEAESQLNVPSHVFLGEHIAAKWGLPQVIRHAIRYHHVDVRNSTTILQAFKPAIYIVSLSNSLVVQNHFGHSGDCSDGALKNFQIEALGLTVADLEKIKEKIDQEMTKASSFLSVGL